MITTSKLQKQHLYLQLADILRDDIAAHKYPSGRLPTEQQLVEKNGVSIITIRKALECLVKEGILTRRQGQGTFIRALSGVGSPQSLKVKRRTRMFCYISGPGSEMTAGNFFNRLMLEAQKTGEDNDYNAILSSSYADTLPMPIERKRVDGVILAGTFRDSSDISEIPFDIVEENERYINMLTKTGYPVVTVSNINACHGVTRINPDYEQAFRDVFQILTQMGHRRIAYFSGPLTWPVFGARYKAFKRQLKQSGLDSDGSFEIILNKYSWIDPEESIQKVRHMLSQEKRPSALVMGSGSPVFVMEGVKQARLKIPEDISIIGLADRPPLSENSKAPKDIDDVVPSRMAVLEVPVANMGTAAVKRLLQIIEGKTFANDEQDYLLPMIFHPGRTIDKYSRK